MQRAEPPGGLGAGQSEAWVWVWRCVYAGEGMWVCVMAGKAYLMGIRSNVSNQMPCPSEWIDTTVLAVPYWTFVLYNSSLCRLGWCLSLGFYDCEETL